jgi:hypothetical protein
MIQLKHEARAQHIGAIAIKPINDVATTDILHKNS